MPSKQQTVACMSHACNMPMLTLMNIEKLSLKLELNTPQAALA